MTIEIKPIHHSDAAVTTSVDRLDRVGAHEHRYISPDRHFRDTKITGQIVVCIMPPMAQYLQQLLPPFTWAHALTPLRCSWGDAKKLMGRLLSHSSKFVKIILDVGFLIITLPPKI